MSNPANTTGVGIYTPPSTAVTRTNETAATALAARAKAEVEARAVVAMNRPRNIDTFRVRILAACERTVFAEAAMYKKPIGTETITGLSIRFAEECARHYGNLDVSSVLIGEDDDRRVFEVRAIDLEANNAFSYPVTVSKTVERKFVKRGDEIVRQRMNSKGEPLYIIRADDDALLVKQNALLAKAQREVILKHIPSDVKEEAETNIAALLKSKVQQDPEGEKKKIIDGFFDVGVMPDQIVEFLGHPIEAVNPAELHVLRQLFRGIKDGEATWADVMAQKGKSAEAGAPTAETNGKGATSKLRDAVAKKPEPAKVAAAPIPSAPTEETEAERNARLAEDAALAAADQVGHRG